MINALPGKAFFFVATIVLRRLLAKNQSKCNNADSLSAKEAGGTDETQEAV